ncbi:MAG: hypothetical protein HRU11_00575 [Parvularculaceae bacterium]|nr:hypothetical protein [Parvularculaceae bacterium]
MADRLDQIWKSFASTTRARLTSTDISAHARPPTRSMQTERRLAEEALFEGRADASDAVQAAMMALHTDLQAKAKRGSRRREASMSFDAGTQTPPSALDDTLLADLKFTEARVRRSGSDYLSYAVDRQEAWKKRRKKFLGIF